MCEDLGRLLFGLVRLVKDLRMATLGAGDTYLLVKLPMVLTAIITVYHAKNV